MGWNNYVADCLTVIETCPKCGKDFKCTYEEQIPGCRFPEDKVCPHCKAVLRTSMEYEFFTRKI